MQEFENGQEVELVPRMTAWLDGDAEYDHDDTCGRILCIERHERERINDVAIIRTKKGRLVSSCLIYLRPVCRTVEEIAAEYITEFIQIPWSALVITEAIVNEREDAIRTFAREHKIEVN